MKIGPIRREDDYQRFLRHLARYLEYYMLAERCSMADIARAAGLAPTTIQKIVAQERQAVMTSTLWNILDAT